MCEVNMEVGSGLARGARCGLSHCVFGVALMLIPVVASAGDPQSLALQRRDNRADFTQKGSLLVYPAVEVAWDDQGRVVRDTVIHLSNDFSDEVRVQVYYVNGDAPIDEVIAGDPPMVVIEAEPGWNNANCQLVLTGDQPIYWSAANGGEPGCQPFTIIDPNGRPSLDGRPGERVVRGFVLIWAIDLDLGEISWNHLSGYALSVDYANADASEYGAYALQARKAQQGSPTDQNPGVMLLNGREYDALYNQLILPFKGTGSAYGTGLAGFSVDTDLSLWGAEVDLRRPEDAFGLVETDVVYDVWNMNERRFSGTRHRLTCWRQRLFSDYSAPNNLLRSNLQTDRGKIRIDGKPSLECDEPLMPLGLLGVARTVLAFSGNLQNPAETAVPVRGSGCESGAVMYEFASSDPEELREDESLPRALERDRKLGTGSRNRAQGGE